MNYANGCAVLGALSVMLHFVGMAKRSLASGPGRFLPLSHTFASQRENYVFRYSRNTYYNHVGVRKSPKLG